MAHLCIFGALYKLPYLRKDANWANGGPTKWGATKGFENFGPDLEFFGKIFWSGLRKVVFYTFQTAF